MKYVFNGKNIQNIPYSPFRVFLTENQNNIDIQYVIESIYKGPSNSIHKSSNVFVQYIDRIKVIVNGHSSYYTFNPTQFIEKSIWESLFTPYNEHVRNTVCNNRFRIRKPDTSVDKYKITTNNLKKLFVRNTVWKLAAQGINTDDKNKQSVVIPLSITEGRITRLAIVNPNNVIPKEIFYNDWRFAPSFYAFNLLYEIEEIEEIEEAPVKEKEFLTIKTAKDILEMAQKVQDCIVLGTNMHTEYTLAKVAFVDFVRGLVK